MGAYELYTILSYEQDLITLLAYEFCRTEDKRTCTAVFWLFSLVQSFYKQGEEVIT